MKLRIWSHLLKKSLMRNFIFCAVNSLNIYMWIHCYYYYYYFDSPKNRVGRALSTKQIKLHSPNKKWQCNGSFAKPCLPTTQEKWFLFIFTSFSNTCLPCRFGYPLVRLNRIEQSRIYVFITYRQVMSNAVEIF